MEKKLEELIDDRLKSLGISQSKMCNDLGLSRSNTCSFLKGRRGLKYDVLISILKYLGLTFGMEGEETSNADVENAPLFFKECVKSKCKRITDIDLPIHYCTLVSFTTGDRIVTSNVIAKLMPVFGITLLPYKKEV